MRLAWVLLAAAPLMAADAPPEKAVLELSLKRAVDLAVSPEGSAQIQISNEGLKQAQSRSAQSRAALLPNMDAAFTENNVTANLAANGLTSVKLPFAGFSFPSLVGPFNVMDARLSLNQTVFDFSALRRFQASKAGISAAKGDVNTAEEQVAARVARAYLAAIRADADVESAGANVTLAQALLAQAQDQKSAGNGTGIEITRASVQLAADRQKLLVAQNSQRSARLQLLRAMGLRLDTEIALTDKLQFIPVDSVTLAEAKTVAMKQRPELQAQQQREANARLAASATRLERLPTVAAVGNYGSSGSGLTNNQPTRVYGISIKVPVFDGGRRDARREESASQYRAEKSRTNDLKEQIELDVRLALDSLRSAEEQVKVSKEGLGLAESELTQARRRNDAGVALSLEVTDAQTRLERARDNQTAALYAYNLARIELAQAMGKVRSIVQ
jgi:outer membrane protein